MITLKNNKLPKSHLKLHGYKIESDNEYITEYRKSIYMKNEYNYPLIYHIHIFYHKDNTDSDVCVSVQEYNPEIRDYRYDWYSGEYEYKSMPIIGIYDHGLLKYLKEVE